MREVEMHALYPPLDGNAIETGDMVATAGVDSISRVNSFGIERRIGITSKQGRKLESNETKQGSSYRRTLSINATYKEGEASCLPGGFPFISQ
ncbi:MAG: hypothetical protein F4246_02965 [Rhodothermaceae bacterium]|nr:hypothetical protein [Rhodothermaceae bacterium]MYD55958.1 hypothetical protein [Rhodothermaceae bacterium]MYJ54842.1 hypothetical protein [Rhodothermaceae bacterium]